MAQSVLVMLAWSILTVNPEPSNQNTVWDLEVNVYLFVSLQKPQQNRRGIIQKQHQLFTLVPRPSKN